MAKLIVAAEAEGPVVVSPEGLSFWGGVDAATGVVIDAHHPLCGETLAGKVVLMPTSRGSCSGSGVLLELALAGVTPAALVFREAEDVLTLGALIAARMFRRDVAVVRVDGAVWDALAREPMARVTGGRLQAGPLDIQLARVSEDDLDLSAADRAMLDGAEGEAVQVAMQTLCTVAAAQGATQLVDVSRAHIDGCIYGGAANLRFAEVMRDMGAKVRIPTTMNAISVDLENWQRQGVPPSFGMPAARLAEAYVAMGARANFSCAPYLHDAPSRGEAIGWSESNAVIFANSVLGARTAKHPDFLDLFIAMTGRAPLAGVYLDEARRADLMIAVDLPDGADDAVWSMLGWLAGRMAPDCIPLLTGLEEAGPSQDDLKALCAAFGTTSAAPMLHVAGVTLEGDVPARDGAAVVSLCREDLRMAWEAFNPGPEEIDLVAFGSPHFSIREVRAMAEILGQRQAVVPVIVTLGRETLAMVRNEGLIAPLEAAGVQFVSDICWCSITEPVFPPAARVVMTNSGKYAHYAPGLSGRAVRFGSLRECVEAAVTGRAPGMPGWL